MCPLILGRFSVCGCCTAGLTAAINQYQCWGKRTIYLTGGVPNPSPHSASWWVTHICLNTDLAGVQPFFSRYISHVLEDLIPYSKSCIYTNVRETVSTDKTVCQIKKYHCTEQNSLSAFHTTTPTNASSCFRNNFFFLDSKFIFKTICIKRKPT